MKPRYAPPICSTIILAQLGICRAGGHLWCGEAYQPHQRRESQQTAGQVIHLLRWTSRRAQVYIVMYWFDLMLYQHSGIRNCHHFCQYPVSPILHFPLHNILYKLKPLDFIENSLLFFFLG